jgi:hypothetical protein
MRARARARQHVNRPSRACRVGTPARPASALSSGRSARNTRTRARACTLLRFGSTTEAHARMPPTPCGRSQGAGRLGRSLRATSATTHYRQRAHHGTRINLTSTSSRSAGRGEHYAEVLDALVTARIRTPSLQGRGHGVTSPRGRGRNRDISLVPDHTAGRAHRG